MRVARTFGATAPGVPSSLGTPGVSASLGGSRSEDDYHRPPRHGAAAGVRAAAHVGAGNPPSACRRDRDIPLHCMASGFAGGV